jgi:hypothetical protein
LDNPSSCEAEIAGGSFRNRIGGNFAIPSRNLRCCSGVSERSRAAMRHARPNDLWPDGEFGSTTLAIKQRLQLRWETAPDFGRSDD